MSINDRYKLIKSTTKGVDSRVDEVLDNPNGDLAKRVSICEKMYKSKLKKGYVEAALLCETDLEKIGKVLEISVETLEVYSYFFFDTLDFDRLSKVEHIESISDSNKNEMLLKMWALSHGLDFLSWRLGHKVTLSPVDGLVDLFSTCIYKSKEAMYNPSSSESSKESTKWAKLSTDIARLLKMWVMDSSAAKKDLELAIQEIVPDFEGIDMLLESNKLLELSEELGSQSLESIESLL